MNDLDQSFNDTWDRRKANLGFHSYEEYKKSNHWNQVKAEARKRPNYQKCEFCNETKIEFHHKSYKWIFTKNELLAIISLCRKHHQEVHDFAKEKGVSVRIATNKLMRKYKINYQTPNRRR